MIGMQTRSRARAQASQESETLQAMKQIEFEHHPTKHHPRFSVLSPAKHKVHEMRLLNKTQVCSPEPESVIAYKLALRKQQRKERRSWVPPDSPRRDSAPSVNGSKSLGHPYDLAIAQYLREVEWEKKGLADKKAVGDAWERVLKAKTIGYYVGAPSPPSQSNPPAYKHEFQREKSLLWKAPPSPTRSQSSGVKSPSLTSSDRGMRGYHKEITPSFFSVVLNEKQSVDSMPTRVRPHSPIQITRSIRDQRPPTQHEIYNIRSKASQDETLNLSKYLLHDPLPGNENLQLPPMFTNLAAQLGQTPQNFTYKPRFEAYLGNKPTSAHEGSGQTVLYEVPKNYRRVTETQKRSFQRHFGLPNKPSEMAEVEGNIQDAV